MTLKPLIATLLVGALTQLPVMAQEAASTGAEAASAATPSAPPASAATPGAGTSASKVVPNIVVRWDCGGCEQNSKVAPLIEKLYQDEARTGGHAVSTTETAEITIKEYRQRNPATRVLFGAFAGKDKLAAILSFRGQQYTVDDYSANALQGMNSLCLSVARQALAQVLAASK